MEILTVNLFLDYYEKIRERTNRLVKIIPPELLNWSYMPGKFTLGDQVRHIAATERYMFAETIAGRPCAYVGCGSNLADDYDEVVNFFNEMHRQSLTIFSNLTDEDLQSKCTTPGNAKITIWKWLRAMTEHEIHHRGQLYLYLNMLGITTPPMFGLTSEEIIINSKR